ncbi:Hypothetical predicted protein [Pelobates cultripes]|uniref:Uncharacterized protein n=1 Tax=Pelobates cultripes TaxID=61616 RepID=A0AAD1T8N6_PELCU|nr:Hypothetical predicted protein [Pelobates cultripes]
MLCRPACNSATGKQTSSKDSTLCAYGIGATRRSGESYLQCLHPWRNPRKEFRLDASLPNRRFSGSVAPPVVRALGCDTVDREIDTPLQRQRRWFMDTRKWALITPNAVTLMRLGAETREETRYCCTSLTAMDIG